MPTLQPLEQSKVRFHLGYNLGTPAVDLARLHRAINEVPDDWTATRIGELILLCDDAFDLTTLVAGEPLPSSVTAIAGDLQRSTSLSARDPYNRRLRAYLNQSNFLASTLGVRNYRDPDQAGQGFLIDGALFINSIVGPPGPPGPPGADGGGEAIDFSLVPVFSTSLEALVGGLSAGDLYRLFDGTLRVVLPLGVNLTFNFNSRYSYLGRAF